MRVAKIKIKNVLGVEELEIQPGAYTLLEGTNGVGKTSVIEAIKSLFAGGHDATLLRAGTDVGEVVLELDDETEIRKRITARDSTLTVKRPGLGVIRGPQQFVSMLADGLSANPIAFLMADPKQQTEYLLESCALELPAGAVAEAVQGTVRLPSLEGSALDVLDRVRKTVYDERTGVNRAAKEKQATVTQLSASLPDEIVTGGAPVNVAELRTQEEALLEQARARSAEIDQERDTQIEEIKAAAQRQIDEVRAAAQRLKDAVTEESVPRVRELAAQIAAAETTARESERHANTLDVVNGLKHEVADLDSRSDGLTEALARIDQLRVKLLSKLPIPGLEIVGGVIMKGDVPFSRLNQAERVKVAIQLAVKRAGDLKLICVDGLECLDSKTFNLFCERAAASNLQMIVTRVNPAVDAENRLTITSHTAAVA